ncbi:MAG: class II aldolase/adducin family protein [Clostridia bacterium]|nr:class II aldolase/adducin family protein [Clostridia bacterium]
MEIGESREVTELKAKVASCCQILYIEGHDDANLGHVSARLPGESVFYMKPQGLGLEEVRAEDVLTLNWEGQVLAGPHPAHNEYPIHSEIYRARPDVNCVIHTHPFYSTVFSTLAVPFQTLNHDGVLFAHGLKVFDRTPDLLVTKEQGESLAADLGDADAILLRNHGTVVVGRSVEEACLTQLALEKAVKVLLQAIASGKEFYPMDLAMAEKMAQDVRQNQRRTQNVFAYYQRKAQRLLGI